MQIIASLLSEDDVSSVSAWLASLPLPDDSSPLPAGALTAIAGLRDPKGALDAYAKAAELGPDGPAGEGRPRQRRVAARSVGGVREGRRRAGVAGRPAWGAEILSRQPRHRRPPDTASAIFWLKNRRRDLWRDAPAVVVNNQNNTLNVTNGDPVGTMQDYRQIVDSSDE
jgi:hypothetical protein